MLTGALEVGCGSVAMVASLLLKRLVLLCRYLYGTYPQYFNWVRVSKKMYKYLSLQKQRKRKMTIIHHVIFVEFFEKLRWF